MGLFEDVWSSQGLRRLSTLCCALIDSSLMLLSHVGRRRLMLDLKGEKNHLLFLYFSPLKEKSEGNQQGGARRLRAAAAVGRSSMLEV